MIKTIFAVVVLSPLLACMPMSDHGMDGDSMMEEETMMDDGSEMMMEEGSDMMSS